MTIYPGRYTVHKQAVYVAKVNGAVWDYKIIYRATNEPMYMVATEMITGERIHNQAIKSDRPFEEAEEYLEEFSKQFSIG